MLNLQNLVEVTIGDEALGDYTRVWGFNVRVDFSLNKLNVFILTIF